MACGKRSKYGAKKVTIDGITFDSKKESKRYQELMILQKSGSISNLQMQVKYILIPAQYEQCDEVYTKGRKKGQMKRGKLIERECLYIADFVYFDRELQEIVVEDTKGMRTKDYIIKRKLMLERHGIRIREV